MIIAAGFKKTYTSVLNMIYHYSINEFSKKFCFNSHRSRLFDYFYEELENVKRQSSKMRVLVFGSFITKKEKPSDIDVLISIVPNRDWSYHILKKGLKRIHSDEIDVQFSKQQMFLENCDKLIENFNTNKINKKKKIRINDAVEVKLDKSGFSCS